MGASSIAPSYTGSLPGNTAVVAGSTNSFLNGTYTFATISNSGSCTAWYWTNCTGGGQMVANYNCAFPEFVNFLDPAGNFIEGNQGFSGWITLSGTNFISAGTWLDMNYEPCDPDLTLTVPATAPPALSALTLDLEPTPNPLLAWQFPAFVITDQETNVILSASPNGDQVYINNLSVG
jgi:hypothetical protein